MSGKLINQETYDKALMEWKAELSRLLVNFKKLSIPVFEITNEPSGALPLSRQLGMEGMNTLDTELQYIFEQCEIKKPDVVSFVPKKIDVKNVKQTKLHILFSESGENEALIRSILDNNQPEIEFLNSIFGQTGYFVYLHYSNAIFRYSIGIATRLEKDFSSPWVDDDEFDEDYDYEEIEYDTRTPEELEAARIEADRKSKALDDRILAYAEELISNKKFALVKSKKQCIKFMGDVLGERLSSENANVRELIAQNALHLYEFEYLPREVAKLKDNDPREIADQLGITLPKVKKLLGMI